MRLQFLPHTIASLLLCSSSFPPSVNSFLTPNSSSNHQRVAFHTSQKIPTSNHDFQKPPPSSSSSSTSLDMVFDFFKKRASEGVEQLSNLSTKALEGKLSEGLSDVASYTTVTNAAFAVGLAKSRNRLLYDLESALSGGGDVMEELEDVLLQADLGIKTSEDVMEEIRSLREDSTEIISREDVKSVLRGKLIEALNAFDEDIVGVDVENPSAIRFSGDGKVPTVLFVMGANGMGKTTTIGKLASRLRNEGGQRVLLAACDTFRAGAVEQLEMWAERAEVDCYGPNEKQKTPSAVLYGALDKTIDGEYDTLIVDTSGRLSNNEALTEELAKMKRVIQKRLSKGEEDGPNMDTPHETLLVIDAAQGRMALDSAKAWHEDIGLTGLVLTKLDGSAKGGSVVAVSRELGLPVKLIGVGEKIDDLRDFEAEVFVDGLLGIGKAGGGDSANEGKALESRLKEMRKARDDRAKTMKKSTPAESSGGGMGGMANMMNGGAGNMSLQPMEDGGAATAVKSPPSALNKPKKKNKNKKKKRKGKR